MALRFVETCIFACKFLERDEEIADDLYKFGPVVGFVEHVQDDRLELGAVDGFETLGEQCAEMLHNGLF